MVLHSIDGASHNDIIRGRRALAALGLLVSYLTYHLQGEKKYQPSPSRRRSFPAPAS